MVAVAGSKIDRAGLPNRPSLVCADAAKLPIAAGVADAVLMTFALELFGEDDLPVVLQECRRVLTRAGRLCIVTLAKREPPGVMSRLYEWSHRTFPSVVDCGPIDVCRQVESAGMTVLKRASDTMYGLPVECVLAANE